MWHNIPHLQGEWHEIHTYNYFTCKALIYQTKKPLLGLFLLKKIIAYLSSSLGNLKIDTLLLYRVLWQFTAAQISPPRFLAMVKMFLGTQLPNGDLRKMRYHAVNDGVFILLHVRECCDTHSFSQKRQRDCVISYAATYTLHGIHIFARS